jgi:uncharacterized membrane protein
MFRRPRNNVTSPIILKELNPSWLGSMDQRLYQVELTDQLLKLKFIPSGDEVISTPY